MSSFFYFLHHDLYFSRRNWIRGHQATARCFFFFLSETQITTFFFIFYFFLQHRTVNYSHPTCSESFFSTTPSFYKLRKTDFLVEVQNNRKTFSGIHNVGWSKQSDVGLGPHCKQFKPTTYVSCCHLKKFSWLLMPKSTV